MRKRGFLLKKKPPSTPTGEPFYMPLLKRFEECAGDEAAHKSILAEGPQALYLLK
jgi:hypothetical protein